MSSKITASIARRAALGFAALALVPAVAGANTVAIQSGSANEAAGQLVVTLTLTEPALGGEIATIALRDGTAFNGADFNSPEFVDVRFAAGARSATTAIQLVNDGVAEPTETFGTEIILTSPTLETGPDLRFATQTILDGGARTATPQPATPQPRPAQPATQPQPTQPAPQPRPTQPAPQPLTAMLASDGLGSFKLDRRGDAVATFECLAEGSDCDASIELRLTGGKLARGLRRGMLLGREIVAVAEGDVEGVTVDLSSRVASLLRRSSRVTVQTIIRVDGYVSRTSRVLRTR